MISGNNPVSQYDIGYINKNYILNERPFPISDIYITADYNGTGKLHLTLRTPLVQSAINRTMDGIKWGPKSHIWNHDDNFRWHFDLNIHKKEEIKKLFNNVLSRLSRLTTNIETQDRIHLIQQQVCMMLDMYFINYTSRHLPPDFFITSDKREKDFLDNNVDAKDLYLAVRKIDIEKVHTILSKGTNPNSFYYGFTALYAAIHIDSLTHAKTDPRSQSKMLDIISLLLEYGADPMLETSFGHTAFEDTVKHSLFAKQTPTEYYEQAIRRLTAAPSFHPHMHTDIHGGTPSIGKVIHGANLFYKELTVNNQMPCQINNMFCWEDSLVFCVTDGQTIDQITVTMMSADDFKDEEKNKVARHELYELTKNNFPWQTSFKSEDAFKEYFYPFLSHPSNIIETVYLNNHLVGIIFSEKLWINHKSKEYIVHFNKLSVADKVFRDKYKGFMTNLAYAEVFSLQVIHPNIPVLYFFEAASISSYLGAKDIAYPKIQNDEMNALMNEIAEKLYGMNKITRRNNMLFTNDDLASATAFKSPSPSSFWSKRDIEVKVYDEHYQMNKHSLLMGFFSNGNNLTKIHKQIKKNVGGDRFFDMIKLYTQHNAQKMPVMPNPKL